MAIKALTFLGSLVPMQALFMEEFGAKKTETNGTAKKVGVCDCQGWADVYFSGKAMCGRGNELYFLSKYGMPAAYAATEPITGLPHKVCVDFFKNFQTPSCVNVDLIPFPVDNETGKQWCYVSNDCENLNGGEYATNSIGFAMGAWSNQQSTNTLAWKYCEPGVDPMLKAWPVQDLISVGTYSDVSLSRIFRLAYPTVKIDWGEAQAFMCAVNDAYAPALTLSDMVDAVPAPAAIWGTKATEVFNSLVAIVKSEQGTVLDTPGHGDEFWVIQGRSAWQVKRIELGNMAYLGGHFSEEFTVTCLFGCAPPSEREGAVDVETN